MITAKLHSSLHAIRHCFLRFSSVPRLSSPNPLEDSIKAAVDTKNYEKIPNLISALQFSCQDCNPFSFLTTFTVKLRTNIVDDILRSFSSLRPRSYLLSYTLQSPDPLPLSFAVLQHMLRSGCVPVPETHLLLSTAWLECRLQSKSVSNILLEMQSIGYNPDCGICNYLILTLCRVNQLKEAVKLLNGMAAAGCIPDLDSFGTLVSEMIDLRMTSDVAENMKEMVGKFYLSPRQQLMGKVAALFQANKEIWRAVEMVEFSERMYMLGLMSMSWSWRGAWTIMNLF